MVPFEALTETVELHCADGADNDADGAVDCDDPDCGLLSVEHAGDIVHFEDWYGLTAADADLDGDDDLLVSGFYGGWLTYYRNDATTFTQAANVRVYRGPSTSAAADLDDDGDIDLVVGEYGTYYYDGSSVLVAENDGTGTFGAPREVYYGPGAQIRQIVVADLDGDGARDLYVATDLGLLWLRNAGGATFDAPTILDSGIYAQHGVVADLDGDGDPDLAATTDGELRWYVGEGGTFAPVDLGPGGVVAASDLDGDGDLDLVNFPSDLEWLENTGTGFAAPVSIGPDPGAASRWVVPTDLDGDGLDDLVAWSRAGPYPLVYRSLGGGAFSVGRPQIGFSCEAEFVEVDLDEASVIPAHVDGGQDLICLDLSGEQEIVWAAPLDCLHHDADGDGVSNGDEADLYGTDPFVSDLPADSGGTATTPTTPTTPTTASTTATAGSAPEPKPSDGTCGCDVPGVGSSVQWGLLGGVALFRRRARVDAA